MPTRRTALALTASALLPRAVRAARPLDVVIVGAGIAGLAAAQRLRDRGATVRVLEARDRIGGRIVTSRQWSDLPIDLGAAWIHGITGNPIAALAERLGIARTLSGERDELVLLPGGAQAGAAYAAEFAAVKRLVRAARNAANRLDRDVSLADAVRAHLGGALPSGAARVALDAYVNGTIEQEYAADWTRLSAWNFDDDRRFDGPDALPTGGFGRLIEALAREIDVTTRAVVTHVVSSASGVEVRTTQGAVRARSAIVTLPLGVLQRGDVTFAPALPRAHRAAIAQLGMGLLDKAVLRFAAPFWPVGSEWIRMLTPQRGVWAEWIVPYPEQPVIVGFNAGEAARRVEGFDDAATTAHALARLRDMFGPSVPQPQSVQITRWSRDRYAGGSYSYEPPGASRDTRVRLAQPPFPRVILAGEATHPDYPATVHGAYLSGLRAADAVNG